MIKIMKYGQVPASEIFDRGTAADDVSGIVRDIIKDVSENGDTALKKYCAKFDGFDQLMPLEVVRKPCVSLLMANWVKE